MRKQLDHRAFKVYTNYFPAQDHRFYMNADGRVFMYGADGMVECDSNLWSLRGERERREAEEKFEINVDGRLGNE